MSSPTKESELKAGHKPAVKVSGMRITQHKPPKTDDKHLLEEEDINGAALKVPTSPAGTVSVSGAPVRGNADFPAEAVHAFHDKHHESRPAHTTKPSVIHQPRK